MKSLIDRLASPAPDLCFYGLAPPKLGTDPARLVAIVEAQTTRLRQFAPDGLVVYDLQDESDRQASARPFPFLPTIPPAVYAYESLQALSIPKIVYRCVAGDTPENLSRWLAAPPPDGVVLPAEVALIHASANFACTILGIAEELPGPDGPPPI